jgi:biopolymer transport protein ExbD
MPKIKIPKKSTIVDMTAMTDVAFLLLTFFILTAKFKPQNVVAVDVPQARSTKEVKDAITILIDKEGKAFIALKESATRYAMLDQMIERYGNAYPGLKTLDENQKKYFSLVDTWGTPVEDMSRVLKMNGQEFKKYQEIMPGVPYDSLHNQLGDWIQASRYATEGKIRIAIKSDKNTSVGYVKDIIKTLTARDINRFLLVTTLSQGSAAQTEEGAAEEEK